MATIEKVGVFTHVDEEGNETALYPVTKLEGIDDFDKADDLSYVSLLSNEDLLGEADKGTSAKRIVRTDSTTMSTPYANGLTDTVSSGTAYINMSSEYYGTIVYIVSGSSRIFIRSKSNGTWETEWTELSRVCKNYVSNSALLLGSIGWIFEDGVTVDTEVTHNSHPSIKLSLSDNTESVVLSCTKTSLPYDDPAWSMTAGEAWTLSYWYYVEDASGIDNIQTPVNGCNTDSTSSVGIGNIGYIAGSDLVTGEWTRVSRTITADADYHDCFFQITMTATNGTVWLTDFKLEKNKFVTDWCAADEDLTLITSDYTELLWRGTLTDEDNLNNVTTPGLYWYATGAIPANAPNSNASYVEVLGMGSSSGVMQRVTRQGVAGVSHFRSHSGNADTGWLDWKGYSTTDHTHSDATTSAAGFMTANMVTKLNGIATGATKNSVANNLTTTTSGYALDARQGKVLNNKIPSVKCGIATIGYYSSTWMTKNVKVGTAYAGKYPVVCLVYADQQPYNQVTQILTTAVNSSGNFTIWAYGSGFVSGHALSVAYIVTV